MRNALKLMDSISQEPNLYIKENKRFKNCIGGIISISIYLLFSLLSYFFIKIFLQGENRYYIFEESIENQPTFNLTNYPIMFTISDKDGNVLEDPEKHFNFVAKKQEINFIKKNSKLQKKSLITYINITKCKNLNYSVTFTNKSEEEIDDSKYCLDLSDKHALINIKGEIENNTFISIDIGKCINTSEKNNCSPNDENYSEDSMPSLTMYFSHFLVKKNTLESYLFKETIPINNKNLKVKNFQFSIMDLINNNMGTKKFIKIKESNDEFYYSNEINGDTNLRISISMDRNKTTYFMGSINILFVIPFIYVIFKFVTFVFVNLNFYLNKYYYFNSIANEINVYENLNSSEIISHDIQKNNPFKTVESIGVKLSSKKIFVDDKNEKSDSNSDNQPNRKIERLCLNKNREGNKNLKIVENNNERVSNNFSSNPLFPDNDNINNQKIKKKFAKHSQKSNNLIEENCNNNNENDNNNHKHSFFTIRAWKKKIYTLNFNLKSRFLSLISFFHKNKKLKIAEISKNYIQKKLSVEEIIKKMIEIDKMKFILMKKEGLKVLFNLDGPNIFNNDNRFNKNNLNKIKDTYLLSLATFWKDFEFEK